jgi:hypothetical protein
MEDFVAWRHNKISFFPVWSAYHGEWKHQFGENERNSQAPGQSRTNGVWDSLWKSLVSAKVIFFAWKYLHCILLCYGVLANRHAPISSQCSRCTIYCEDIKHVLFGCVHAKEIWTK